MKITLGEYFSGAGITDPEVKRKLISEWFERGIISADQNFFTSDNLKQTIGRIPIDRKVFDSYIWERNMKDDPTEDLRAWRDIVRTETRTANIRAFDTRAKSEVAIMRQWHKCGSVRQTRNNFQRDKVTR